MQRINTAADAYATGEAEIDVGAGLTARIALGKRRYTVDETAGRVVKVWDYLNSRDQIVFGDTGWREIAATDGGSGNIHVRRFGNLVTVRLNGVTLTAGSFATYFATLPPGFRNSTAENYMIGTAGGSSDWQKIGFYGGSGAKIAWIQTLGGSSTRPAGALTGETTFSTTDPWPTTLPGNAVGSIPL